MGTKFIMLSKFHLTMTINSYLIIDYCLNSFLSFVVQKFTVYINLCNGLVLEEKFGIIFIKSNQSKTRNIFTIEK